MPDMALAQYARERDDGYRVPLDVVARVVEGANPLKVYRKWRGLTQAQLAAQAGINAVYLSQIETGQRRGSMTTLKKLARALGVGLDVIAR